MKDYFVYTEVLVSFIDLETCEPGTVRNIQTLTCDDCGIGFYQNQYNQLFCYSCLSGFTTITSNSTQADQCLGILTITIHHYSY